MRHLAKILRYLNKQFYKFFFPSNLKIEGSCSKCGTCCKKIFIMIDDKSVFKEEEFYRLQRDILSYRYFAIAGRETSGELYFKCNLFKDNQCSKYKNRPLICRKYPSVDMLKYGGVLNDSCSYKMRARKSFDFFLKE